MTELGLPFAPAASPVEYLSLGGIGPGMPVRATVSDFGPQLLGKVLEANETQEQSLALVFHYADEKGLPLLDLADLRALLTFLDSDAGKDELEGIGGLASSTVGRAPARARGPRGRRRQRVLRRAPARHRGPDATRPRTGTAWSPCSSSGRAGQAEALLHRADVAARGAVRAAARGRRPRQAEARVLLRRGPPAVPGRHERLPRVGDPDGAADPLEGRGGVLRHPGPRRRARLRPRASSATGSSTRSAPSLRTTPRRSRRRPPPTRPRTSTTSRSCSPAWGSARRR